MSSESRGAYGVTVPEIAESFARVAQWAWNVSPERTFVGLTVALEAIAVLLVARKPTRRAAVITRLREVATCVEADTGVRH